MRSFRLASCLLASGLCLYVAGCSRGPELAEVEGTVKVNGKPVDKIVVEFWPQGQGPRSRGETDSQGRYTLTTDDGAKKGAVVGSHKVILRDAGVLGDKFLGRAGENVDMTQGRKPRIANEYTDPHASPITKQVNSGKNTIDLEAKP